MNSLSTLVTDLAEVGVELRAEGGDLLFRPAALPAHLLAGIRAHKPFLLRLAREREGCPEVEAEYVLNERLGTADDLGLPTHPGAIARDIALREARRASAGILPDITRSREPDLIDHALGAFADLGGLTCMRVERPTPRKGLSP